MDLTKAGGAAGHVAVMTKVAGKVYLVEGQAMDIRNGPEVRDAQTLLDYEMMKPDE